MPTKNMEPTVSQAAFDFERLLDYEIRCANRYRRFVSIAMVASPNGHAIPRQNFGPNMIRDCDEFFEFKDVSVILMGETDSAGAQAALERCMIQESDLCFAVASFPFDGRTAAELLASARRRLDKAKKTQARGAVMSAG